MTEEEQAFDRGKQDALRLYSAQESTDSYLSGYILNLELVHLPKNEGNAEKTHHKSTKRIDGKTVYEWKDYAEQWRTLALRLATRNDELVELLRNCEKQSGYDEMTEKPT